MSPIAASILAKEIMPILEGTVPHVASPCPPEDFRELVQDTIAMAAQHIDSVERAGKLDSVSASSIAYYAIQRAKSGRRSYGAGRCDILCAGRFMDSGARPIPLDAEAGGSGDSGTTILDLIPAQGDDPATECARRLDWEEFMGSLDRRSQATASMLAEGASGKQLAARLGVSVPRVSQIKRELASKAKAFFGVKAMGEAVAAPEWRRRLRAPRHPNRPR